MACWFLKTQFQSNQSLDYSYYEQKILEKYYFLSQVMRQLYILELNNCHLLFFIFLIIFFQCKIIKGNLTFHFSRLLFQGHEYVSIAFTVRLIILFCLALWIMYDIDKGIFDTLIIYWQHLFNSNWYELRNQRKAHI